MMDTNYKELLLKDLSARLQYGVKGKVYAEVSDGNYDMWGEMIFYDAPFDVTLDAINVSTEEIHIVAIGNEDTVEFIETQQTDGEPYTIDDFEPYLRPMSSMTEEDAADMINTIFPNFRILGLEIDRIENKCIRFAKIDTENNFGHIALFFNKIYSLKQLDWLNAHHFDYRGLIEKGLAIEAPENMYNEI